MLRISRLSCLVVCLGFLSLSCTEESAKPAPQPRGPSLAGGDTTVYNRTTGAFTLPAPNLDEEEKQLHFAGDILFEAQFVASGSPYPGLGPVFSNTSCAGCHVKNGRGMPSLGNPGDLRSPMLVRVSLDPENLADFPGAAEKATPGQGPIPVPVVGTQLQDHAIFGAEPEVHITIEWVEQSGQYPDGSTYSLRQPHLHYQGQAALVNVLNHPAVLQSLRQTPPVFGLGLLEAVAESDLIANEDAEDRDQDGISGRLNRVWHPLEKRIVIGKFGWKASAPSLLVQTGGAFQGDMGISNPVAPDEDGKLDIDLETVRKTAFYTQTLAVPAPQSQASASSLRGSEVFRLVQCQSCHRESMKTAADAEIDALRNQSFRAYTDLMLHDMGEGLADHRPDFLANGQEWRTPPLWGIGLAETVLPGSAYLHDGRARSLEEAILWHGGEAEASRVAFQKLPISDRQALLSFLKTL